MHILLVDDNLFSLAGLQRFLQLSGHTCDALESPREALKQYQKHPYDLVISDLKMPEMDGIELLTHLRRHHSQAAVLILTGYADDFTASLALERGALAFMTKPADLERILETIETLEKKPP